MKRTYGFWMYLSAKDNKKLLPTIQDLSNDYVNGDVFIPHISIYEAITTTYKEAAEAIDKSLKGFDEFEVQADGIDFEEKWSKTLFIKIKPHPVLTKISTRLGNFFGKIYNLDPHISLMYKSGLQESRKAQIAQNITFSTVYKIVGGGLIDPNMKGKNWHDYARWTMVYQKPLCKSK
jgi:hypothetical protein